MNNWRKLSTATLATIAMATSSIAQDQKDKVIKNKREKTEEIVIRKKGDKAQKMTIVVEGDSVTINGKPVDDFRDEDVTVFKREQPERSFRRFESGDRPFGPGNVNGFFRSQNNKALLGVITEKGDDGVKVKDVTKGSGADKAGIQKDDVITKVGTTGVSNPEELLAAIGKYKPKDKVNIIYRRKGKEDKADVVLGENTSQDFAFNLNKDFNFDFPERPIPPLENFNFDFNSKPRFGLQIQDVEEGKGVKVRGVDEDSPASKAGIKEGDVITQVNGKNISSVDELRSAIKDVKEGDEVKCSFFRDGKNQTGAIKIPKRLKFANL